MADTRQILGDLKKRLDATYSKSLKDVVLFGSRTGNRASEYSDYDILILLDMDYNRKDENQIFDICYDVDLEYNIIIDVHVLSMKELETKRGKQPIFMNALKNGIYA